MQETQTSVRSLGHGDPLKKEMVTRFSIPAWKSHGQRSLAGYSPRSHKESTTTEKLSILTHTHTKLLKTKQNHILDQKNKINGQKVLSRSEDKLKDYSK